MPITAANVNGLASNNNSISSPKQQRRDRDSGDSATSSSGIKSNSDESNEKFRGRKNLSDSESDSSTEKPSKTLMSLNDYRRKHKKDVSHVSVSHNTPNHQHETDEDATLNEIGKFDESYTFEKENEFLR